jgi:cytochrome c-type biogenesis protein CcmF
MIPEIGHFALILSLCLTGLQFFLPIWGLYKDRRLLIQVVHPLVLGQCLFITISFLTLFYAFIQDDFSVAYVAGHSNAALPFFYKLSAVWGGHEGSLLLWIFLFSTWTLAVSVFARHLPVFFLTRVLVILGMIQFGLLLFLLATSNPFLRLLPSYPVDGADLNPLLQDFGFIVHPPLLYMGYVGFAVPFAFAVSVLWGGEKGIPWSKWLRPWVLTAFGFLTIGIALGSWWAYYELGWGGWWFWDPVENASFMPWLVSIALIHSLMVGSKRQRFQSWTLLLTIIVFSLSLLGTFLVRSGVLSSIHAFANDPKRGVFLLGFLLGVIGSALLLYAFRGKKASSDVVFVKGTEPLKVSLVSREAVILISNVLLIVSAASVLLGTLFPLIYDILTGKKLSVGFPYFNRVFIPLIIPVLILIPLGSLMRWERNLIAAIARKVRWIIGASILLGIVLPVFFTQYIPLPVIFGLSLGWWIILGTLCTVAEKIEKHGSISGLSLSAFGMTFAHLGVAVIIIGITLVSHYQIERNVLMTLGQVLSIADYEIEFQNVGSIEGSNYVGYRGHFVVRRRLTSRIAEKVADLFPEKRVFVVQGSKMTETAIDPGLFRDIYISIGDRLPTGKWVARIYYKPFVRCIWLGGLMIAFGSFLAALGRRTRKA